MATLTVQNVVRTGLEATFAACAAGGDAIPNDGRTIAEIINASGSDITVTVVSQTVIDSKALGDDAIVITAAERRHIGPWPTSIYNDVNERVQLTYSGVTTLTIAALRVA